MIDFEIFYDMNIIFKLFIIYLYILAFIKLDLNDTHELNFRFINRKLINTNIIFSVLENY